MDWVGGGTQAVTLHRVSLQLGLQQGQVTLWILWSRGAQEQRNRLATRPFPHEGGGSLASLGHHLQLYLLLWQCPSPISSLAASGESIELRAPFLILKTMKTSAHRERGGLLWGNEAADFPVGWVTSQALVLGKCGFA